MSTLDSKYLFLYEGEWLLVYFTSQHETWFLAYLDCSINGIDNNNVGLQYKKHNQNLLSNIRCKWGGKQKMCSFPNIIGTFVVLSMWINHYPSALSIIDIPQYFMKRIRTFRTILFKV